MVTIHLQNDPKQKKGLPRGTRGPSITRDKRTDAPGQVLHNNGRSSVSEPRNSGLNSVKL